ncbi:histidinol-phosphate transaminase [uncultured Tyzzerella sp.]|uniref:pyridoxal phosphate-dependent aminotransferase n=1 Tax=uncultured Tyzzerella sp. TaxID=2321398 RepID=UPI002941F4A1|nr:histidinol-phosphate transaminase [uncultured Tyzzerella sp.]
MLNHGGDLDIIQKKYNISREKIIDFSGNINPLGISNKIENTIKNNINVITTYPDKDYISLKNSISTYCNCNKNNIIVGNGSTEIISLFIKNLSPKNAIIVSPSYSEYERELKNNNCNIHFFDLKEEDDFLLNVDKLISCINDNIDLIVLCNPNNPTGTAINNNQIKLILNKCKFLMIDETYAEFSSDIENICATSLVNDYDNLFVIRGTSKFFGVPGIRLGYGICKNKNILDKINKYKDPWSVNSIANLIGISMFDDKEYIQNTKNLILNQKQFIFEELSKIKNLKFYKSSSNFILCKILNNKTTSSKLFEDLIKENILIRDAKSFPFLDDTFFRFCILSEKNNRLLIQKFKNILS